MVIDIGYHCKHPRHRRHLRHRLTLFDSFMLLAAILVDRIAITFISVS
jgi:hypothetical protein